MKKRAMKKWIPRNTIYCGSCKWRSFSSKFLENRNGFCKYLGKSDYQLPSTSLLWLGCKECNIGYSIIE